ncbi:MAG: THUMP domain-containing protein [Candidatus Poribacteria bacterium]|nr:THUMP domain-containing protein [Candidatus Poribacteria bacterium]MDE0505254.1 THUMP domain-containing protein [Candidatus Poribacteria bacterium]
MPSARFFATSPKGVESILAKELKALGIENLKTAGGGVHFEGSMETLYRANLWLRTANRVLMQLAEFPCPTPQILYQNARQYRWNDWISAQQTLAVDCNCRNSAINHSHFAALKIKDAIVDQIRDSTGSRPNVDVRNPNVRVNAHIANDRCVLSLDSSGDGLHMRGYRRQATEAPIRETLAAAIVELADWNSEGFFIDPMCGSGTILIEAALKALNYAPGLLRVGSRSFGFQQWRGFDQQCWDEIVSEARNQVRERIPGRLLGYDLSRAAVGIAKNNVSTAGLTSHIRLSRGDVFNLHPSGHTGIIACNLPFGERSGDAEALVPLYKGVGDILKQRCTGYKAYLFSGNLKLVKSIGLRPSRRFAVQNGPIECRLLEYKLY